MSAEAYTDINNGREYPKLTRVDAGKATRVLLRHFGSPRDACMRADYNGEPTAAKRAELDRILRNWTDGHRSGARRCWASTTPTRGHDTGWGRLIHDVSHIVHNYRHPKERPHGPIHSVIEREVQVFVEMSGLLDAKPRQVLSLDEKRAQRFDLYAARLKRWETKAKRANTAIRKLKTQMRRLQRITQ